MMLHNFLQNLLEIVLSKNTKSWVLHFHRKTIEAKIHLSLKIQQDEATRFPIVIYFDVI